MPSLQMILLQLLFSQEIAISRVVFHLTLALTISPHLRLLSHTPLLAP
jgi:hypothetical protein